MNWKTRIILKVSLCAFFLLMTGIASAVDCLYSMDLACPPSEDPQSFVNGLDIQINGGTKALSWPDINRVIYFAVAGAVMVYHPSVDPKIKRMKIVHITTQHRAPAQPLRLQPQF